MQSDQNTETATLTDEQLSDYLRKDPQFFERNAHLLAEIYLPSPHGNGAISLTERQQLAQRDRIRVTEAKLADLIEIGEQNDVTSQKIHDLSVALIGINTLDEIANVVTHHIQNAFLLSHASLHCWVHPHGHPDMQAGIFQAVPQQFSDWIMTLSNPECGAKTMEAEILMNENIVNSTLQSFAFIPLFKHLTRDSAEEEHLPAMGVLILASADARHFDAEMGTLFLARIGDLLSAALIRTMR